MRSRTRSVAAARAASGARRNIARECGGVFHGVILSNNTLDEHTRTDHSHFMQWSMQKKNAGTRRLCVKSTPSSSNASSCSVSSIESASGLGHLYLPRSKRLYQSASPVRSQMIAFTRSDRFPRMRKRSPPIGFAPSVSVMIAHSPEKLRRMSAGATAMKIRVSGGSFSIEASRARAPAQARRQAPSRATKTCRCPGIGVETRLPKCHRLEHRGYRRLRGRSNHHRHRARRARRRTRPQLAPPESEVLGVQPVCSAVGSLRLA